ncbi:MAG: hypothetical protein Q9162_004844 [Coniocarpon cinnabarinum]
MYQTPYTPSPSSASPLHLPRDHHDTHLAINPSTRKRPRSDYFTSQWGPSPNRVARDSDRSFSQNTQRQRDQQFKRAPPSPESPPALANSRYRLQNGLDTPGLTSLDSTTTPFGADQDPVFRRRLASSPSPSLDSYVQPSYPSALSRERSGVSRKRGVDQPKGSETWSAFAWRLATGTASAVWNFCGGAGFSGFKAGGSRGDRAQAGVEGIDGRSRTPIPGNWPDDQEYVKISASDVEVERPAKRRQTTQGDWVIVHDQRPSLTPLQARCAYSSGLQPHIQAQAPGSSGRRSASRSLLPRPAASRRSSHASAAHSRSSSATFVPTALNGSPAQRQPRQASTASMRSPQSSPKHSSHPQQHHRPTSPSKPYLSPPQNRTPSRARLSHDPYDINNPNIPSYQSYGHSPSSAEAINKYQRRRDRDEQKQDASYKKMNQQLQDLISQGQAALASRIEVGDDMTEGNEDFSGDSGVEMGFEGDFAKSHRRGASSASLGRR